MPIIHFTKFSGKYKPKNFQKHSSSNFFKNKHTTLQSFRLSNGLPVWPEKTSYLSWKKSIKKFIARFKNKNLKMFGKRGRKAKIYRNNKSINLNVAKPPTQKQPKDTKIELITLLKKFMERKKLRKISQKIFLTIVIRV